MNVYVWGLTLFAALGGFMFGYDTGVINGVKDMKGFRDTINLSGDNTSNHSNSTCDETLQESTVLGLIVSTFSIGCLFGALAAGAIADSLGRRPAIIIGSMVFIVGGSIQSVTFYVWMILTGRIVAGLGVGVLSMVVPVYNAELAPKDLRGRLVSLQQLAITAGVMVSFLVDLVCERFLEGWRVALGIQALFGIVLVIGMLFLPETPRWLVKRQKDEKAALVLAKLRQTTYEEIQDELSEIQSNVAESRSNDVDLKGKIRVLLSWRILQRVFIGMLLQLFQQLTGMNVIMYYSTSIICRIGGNGYVTTAIFGIINFLTTIGTIFLIDKVGRKILLLIGGVGMLVAMALAATLIVKFDVGEGNHKAVGYIVVALIGIFVFNFAYSWGPVAWVITSEIFPLNVRGPAVSLTTAANWIGNFFVAMMTPILLSSLQTFGTFYLFSGFLLAAILFVLLTLPETKRESLERIDGLFSQPWLQRVNLFYYLRCGCPWCQADSRGKYTIATADLSHQSNSTLSDEDESDTVELLK